MKVHCNVDVCDEFKVANGNRNRLRRIGGGPVKANDAESTNVDFILKTL